MNRFDNLWEKFKIENPYWNMSSSSSSSLSSMSTSSLRSSVLAILHQALADPKTFVGFIQLCTHPLILFLLNRNIPEKDDGEGDEMLDKMIRTCHLFAVGTWSQYRASLVASSTKVVESSCYLHLTSSQIQKLKALSLVSYIRSIMTRVVPSKESSSFMEHLSSTPSLGRMDTEASTLANSSSLDRDRIYHDRSTTFIPYMTIQVEFDFQNIPSLEDFLIYCIYAKLIPPGSKLNQQQQGLMLACCPSSSWNNSSSTLSSSMTTRATTKSIDPSRDDSSLFFSRDVALVTEKNHDESTIHPSTTTTTTIEDMISTLEIIQSQGVDLLQTLDTIQKDNEQLYHTQNQYWMDIDKHLEEVRTLSKATFQNTVLSWSHSSGMMGGGGGVDRGSTNATRNDMRQYKRSRGVGSL